MRIAPAAPEIWMISRLCPVWPCLIRTAPHLPGRKPAAPLAWRRGSDAIVEAFATDDGAAKSVRTTISTLQGRLQDVDGARATLGGVAAEDRDFVHAVYGKFPYVLAFVILLTFVQFRFIERRVHY